jgi:hypothetical protein
MDLGMLRKFLEASTMSLLLDKIMLSLHVIPIYSSKWPFSLCNILYVIDIVKSS